MIFNLSLPSKAAIVGGVKSAISLERVCMASLINFSGNKQLGFGSLSTDGSVSTPKSANCHTLAGKHHLIGGQNGGQRQ